MKTEGPYARHGVEWDYVGAAGWSNRHLDKNLPPVCISALWAQVARIRAREGDNEGAARARVNVKMASSKVGSLTRAQDLIELTAHFRGDSGPACNNAQEGTRITSDPSLVQCGNCRRTRVWRAACRDAAAAAGK